MPRHFPMPSHTPDCRLHSLCCPDQAGISGMTGQNEALRFGRNRSSFMIILLLI